jgi:hypothetical protein
MRPGLAVSISLDSSQATEPFLGTVFRVEGREVVVLFGADRGAAALRLRPRQGVRISYRNEISGEVYAVPAELKAKDGPRSIAFKLLGPPVISEARDQPRVELLLRMDYEVLPPADIERARHEILRGAQIVKYESPPRRSASPAAGAEEESPEPLPLPLSRQLGRIERKLDVLIERLGIESQTVTSERRLFSVNLSTRGVRFRDIQNRCAPGDTVRLHIELPLNPTVEIIALGEVLRTVDTSTGEKLSMGRDVVINFKVMKDESRQAIARFCQLHDASRRTA